MNHQRTVFSFNPLPIGAVSASDHDHGTDGVRRSRFNPLPIGAVSASYGVPDSSFRAGLMFQSPSYRGCLCIPVGNPASRGPFRSFNPLPIGAVSASCVGLHRVRGGSKRFQSPSYRGCLCIGHTEAQKLKEVLMSFNPLPIGAVSASLGGTTLYQPALVKFQSPSYRGCLCIVRFKLKQ